MKNQIAWLPLGMGAVGSDLTGDANLDFMHSMIPYYQEAVDMERVALAGTRFPHRFGPAQRIATVGWRSGYHLIHDRRVHHQCPFVGCPCQAAALAEMTGVPLPREDIREQITAETGHAKARCPFGTFTAFCRLDSAPDVPSRRCRGDAAVIQ